MKQNTEQLTKHNGQKHYRSESTFSYWYLGQRQYQLKKKHAFIIVHPTCVVFTAHLENLILLKIYVANSLIYMLVCVHAFVWIYI